MLSKHQAINTLRIDTLSFSYARQTVLQEVCLQVPRGTICGLLGPNGSGKTTLFKCCLNFLSYKQGDVFIEGINTNKLSAAKMAKLVAYVPQEHKLSFAFTVYEMIAMGRNACMNGGVRLSAKDAQAIEAVMERTGISHLADVPCNNLSGGQRQLVLIARALAQETPLMLLDEPTSALDFMNWGVVWKLLKQIAQSGVTMLICCHDPNHILWFCDSAALLQQGKIIAFGAPKTLVHDGSLKLLFGDTFHSTEINNLPIIYPVL